MTEGTNPGWAVVIAHGGLARVAQTNIERLGYTVDFLWRRKLLRDMREIVAGKRVRVTDGRAVVLRPVFGVYGFVRIDFDFDATDIDCCIGVSRLLRDAGGRPKRLRSGIVDRLRSAAAAGEFDDEALRPTRDDLVPGANVRRADGLVVTIRSIDDAGRVRFAAELFGREIEGRFNRAEARELEVVADG